MLRAHADELLWILGLFFAVVIVAALVNRFRPNQRPRLRRLVTVFALFAVATVASIGFDAAALPAWSSGVAVAAQILQAFTLVSLSATLVFAVVLPGIGIVLPMIASDLIVGLGYVIVTLVILSRNGVNPTGALVSGAVVSAVLAISLQSTLGNVIGGIALQLDGSVREGDWIQLENGKQGRVRSVRWRHTVIEARDFSTIVVPNAQLLATSITILGKRDGRPVPQRISVAFSVDLRVPPGRVIRVVTEALHGSSIENVADDPRPSVICTDLTKERESVAAYAVRYWILDPATEDPTSSRIRARIFTALQRAQISLASPPRGEHGSSEAAADTRAARQADERFAALKTVQLFRSLTDDELRTLAAGMSHAMYTTGEVVTRQGAAANWLYVLTAGTAEIRTTTERGRAGVPPEQPVVVAQVTAPDFFGEMSLMTGEPRSADVVATSDLECFRLGKDTFEAVLLARPDIATELSDKLASRRVELIAAREGLDASSMQAREASERDRILRGIKAFFALGS